MKLVSSLLLSAIAVAPAFAGRQVPSSVAYQTFVRNGIRYHMVIADMNSGRVGAGTVLASRAQPVWNLIGQSQPLAAITGTFFAPRQGVPVADVLVDGNLVAKGDRGSGFGVDHFGMVSIFDERYQAETDWANYRHGMRGAVRVVTRGVVHPNPKAQKFRDRRIWGKAARTGIGITNAGKLVLIATSKHVTLSTFGKAMVSQGVRDGISLDGGSSTCLYFNGKMIIGPRRGLVNLFVLTPKSPILPPAEIAATFPAMDATTLQTASPAAGGKR